MEFSYEKNIELIEELAEKNTSSNRPSELVLFNDDFNTFDYVIKALVEICKHNQHQAEQCTFIIHYRGRCAVKTGSFEELAPMYNAICKRGISAEIV